VTMVSLGGGRPVERLRGWPICCPGRCRPGFADRVASTALRVSR
jgi:hypothetical protein